LHDLMADLDLTSILTQVAEPTGPAPRYVDPTDDVRAAVDAAMASIQAAARQAPPIDVTITRENAIVPAHAPASPALLATPLPNDESDRAAFRRLLGGATA
jgi:hypothetical protein